ncbi:MAG: hypothetical protein ACI33P_00560 [Lysinibacillus sp.]
MKLTEMQSKLQDDKRQLKSLEKLKKQKELLDGQIRRAEIDTEKYEHDLREARKRLNKLENFSFVNLFRTWTGRQDELLAEGYDQLASMELKWKESQLIFEDLRGEASELVSKMNAINEPYLVEQIKSMENKIQLYYMANDPSLAKKLNELVEQEFLMQQLIIEITEALQAGNEAQQKLVEATSALDTASNYSTWDTFLGGGILVTAMKHQELDKSNNYIHSAQRALQRFHNELLDVQEMRHESLQIETDGFVKFADYFFDDIFSAWSVHSKIATSKNQIRRVLDDVANTLNELKGKMALAEEKKKQLAAEKSQLLSKEGDDCFQGETGVK